MRRESVNRRKNWYTDRCGGIYRISRTLPEWQRTTIVWVRVIHPLPAIVMPDEQPRRFRQLFGAATETSTPPLQPPQVRPQLPRGRPSPDRPPSHRCGSAPPPAIRPPLPACRSPRRRGHPFPDDQPTRARDGDHDEGFPFFASTKVYHSSTTVVLAGVASPTRAGSCRAAAVIRLATL